MPNDFQKMGLSNAQNMTNQAAQNAGYQIMKNYERGQALQNELWQREKWYQSLMLDPQAPEEMRQQAYWDLVRTRESLPIYTDAQGRQVHGEAGTQTAMNPEFFQASQYPEYYKQVSLNRQKEGKSIPKSVHEFSLKYYDQQNNQFDRNKYISDIQQTPEFQSALGSAIMEVDKDPQAFQRDLNNMMMYDAGQTMLPTGRSVDDEISYLQSQINTTSNAQYKQQLEAQLNNVMNYKMQIANTMYQQYNSDPNLQHNYRERLIQEKTLNRLGLDPRTNTFIDYDPYTGQQRQTTTPYDIGSATREAIRAAMPNIINSNIKMQGPRMFNTPVPGYNTRGTNYYYNVPR